jgi:hypothetical protein
MVMEEIMKFTKTDLEQIARSKENIPDLHHGAYRKKYDVAMNGNSLRAAIDSKCLDCNCWQKMEVKLCQAVECPLWPHRPYRQNRRESHSVPKKDASKKETD